MAYQPIENYGIIGNMHTVALVGMNGSIDWLCYPHFDSPSVFAAILDDKRGGWFKIAPATGGITNKQIYWPETNVLITRFLSADGVGEVVDLMPVGVREGEPGYHQLVRRVSVVRGTMAFRMECYPAFNYARDAHETSLTSDGVLFSSLEWSLALSASVSLRATDRGAAAEFTLREGEQATFTLGERTVGSENRNNSCSELEADYLFRGTVEYWRNWLSKCKYKGRWREMVQRSALALKLLTYEPTGAIVAAPTCSLPEELGGVRNWDYRYTWIRDAAFTLYALLRIGFVDEATHFMNWIEARCHELNPDGSLQVVYEIDGPP